MHQVASHVQVLLVYAYAWILQQGDQLRGWFFRLNTMITRQLRRTATITDCFTLAVADMFIVAATGYNFAFAAANTDYAQKQLSIYIPQYLYLFRS
jgi:hypothetical protein